MSQLTWGMKATRKLVVLEALVHVSSNRSTPELTCELEESADGQLALGDGAHHCLLR